MTSTKGGAIPAHQYSTVIKLTDRNGEKGYSLFFHNGPALIDIQYWPQGSERRIKSLFEPGLSIPWAELERDGVCEYQGVPRYL